MCIFFKRTISFITVLSLFLALCVTTGFPVFAEDPEPDNSDDVVLESTEEGTTDADTEENLDAAGVDDELLKLIMDALGGAEAPIEQAALVEATPISAPIVSEFSDVTDHWAATAIDFVVRQGLFTGVGDGRFDPNGVLTRGMLVTVLGRYDEAPVEGYMSPFTDVDANQYYASYVAWAAQNNIVAGTGDSKFEPNAIVTREQAARIIASYIRYSSKVPFSSRVLTPFTDEASISFWALEDVNLMRFYGLIEGRPDGSFDPSGSLTRAEASVILKRLVEHAPIFRLKTN